MIRASKKTQQRRRTIKQLDAAARQTVFMRDDVKCVRCKAERNLQWAHIFSRRHLNMRWELDNALTLCAGCHLWWHHEPILATDWFRKNFPERRERLLAMFNAGGKVDLRAKLDDFKGEMR